MRPRRAAEAGVSTLAGALASIGLVFAGAGTLQTELPHLSAASGVCTLRALLTFDSNRTCAQAPGNGDRPRLHRIQQAPAPLPASDDPNLDWVVRRHVQALREFNSAVAARRGRAIVNPRVVVGSGAVELSLSSGSGGQFDPEIAAYVFRAPGLSRLTTAYIDRAAIVELGHLFGLLAQIDQKAPFAWGDQRRFSALRWGCATNGCPGERERRLLADCYTGAYVAWAQANRILFDLPPESAALDIAEFFRFQLIGAGVGDSYVSTDDRRTAFDAGYRGQSNLTDPDPDSACNPATV